MKKAICMALAALVMSFGVALPGYAAGGSRGARLGAKGHVEAPGHPGFRSGHEFFEHRGFRRDHDFRTRVFVGTGFWWGPPWGWWPDYYPYYPYYGEPVVAQPQPQEYIQQGTPYYWYYCTNPPGYYPYIQQCPTPWLTVVPQSTAPTPQY